MGALLASVLAPMNVTMPDAGALMNTALKSGAAFDGEMMPGTSIAGATSETQSVPFASLMSEAIGSVDKLENKAKSAIDGLMSGNGVDVHEAMIASEKAGMAFELALAVRNKAVQSYQSVMGMQF